jgi:hypothetical protein
LALADRDTRRFVGRNHWWALKMRLHVGDDGNVELVNDDDETIWESDQDENIDDEMSADEICEYLAKAGIISSVDDVSEIVDENSGEFETLDYDDDDDDDADALTEIGDDDD